MSQIFHSPYLPRLFTLAVSISTPRQCSFQLQCSFQDNVPSNTFTCTVLNYCHFSVKSNSLSSPLMALSPEYSSEFTLLVNFDWHNRQFLLGLQYLRLTTCPNDLIKWKQLSDLWIKDILQPFAHIFSIALNIQPETIFVCLGLFMYIYFSSV